MPASLWMSANRADGGSKLSATIIGPRMSNMDEVPVPFETASWVSAGSSPAASPRACASAAASVCTATSRLATNFMRVPLPKVPRSYVRRPMTSNSGAARSKPA